MRLAILSLTILIILCGQDAFAQPAARTGLLQKLLDLPAPAPFDPPKEMPKPPERAENFDDDDNIPPDDAPIEDLLDYWSRPYNSLYTARYVPTPSKKTVERILEYCEENPGSTPRYLSIFPSTPEAVEVVTKIREKLKTDPLHQFSGSHQVQEWLKFNSKLYIDELVRDANEIEDRDSYTSSLNQYTLRALANVDWDTALPIVRRLENDRTNPASAVLAKWVVYRHALDTGDSSTADSYREQLKEVVGDKKAGWAIRDLAMDALTHSPGWEGRDEWYLSLLEDETLLTIQDNGYTGLTTMLMESPRKQWLGRMIELTGSTNVTVRTAAARNLMRMVRKGDVNVLRALIPWLSDPAWAKESDSDERAFLIQALIGTTVPEAVPGLIWVVINDKDYRLTAAVALGRYKDPRANPALRMVLAGAETPEERVNLINSVMACGGFSDDEQMAALEAFITMVSTDEGKRQIDDYERFDAWGEYRVARDAGEPADAPALPVEISIGQHIGEMQEQSEGLVEKAIERLRSWKRTNPRAAAILAELMLKWKGPGIYAEYLRRIKSGEIDIDGVITALAARKAIREAIPAELSSLRGATGMTRGIGACIAEDRSENLDILEQKADIEAQTALLGCARMIRAVLPVEEAGKLLQSPDKLLSLAAGRYLESEDSLAARKLALANNKGTAMILGARTAFVPEVRSSYNLDALISLFESVGAPSFKPGDHPILRMKERALRKELADDPNLTNVFAILEYVPGGRSEVRLYKDRAIFRYYENDARYRERDLTKKEYEGLQELLLRENIDALKPVIGDCDETGCLASEFVMFGRDGGRRVYFENFRRIPALAKLWSTFESFQKGDFKLHYVLADKIAGLEVLLADDRMPVRAVWKNGGDVRVVAEDKARGEEIIKEFRDTAIGAIGKEIEEKPADKEAIIRSFQQRLSEAKYAHLSWRKFENGRLGVSAAQPADAAFLYDAQQVKETQGIDPAPRGWQVRSGSGEIRVGHYLGGLFRISPGQDPVELKTGYYQKPIVSADGKWVVASKTEEKPEPFNGIVRVNLQTGREYAFGVTTTERMFPVAFVNSHNQVLVFSGPAGYSADAEDSGEMNDYKPRYFRGAEELPATPQYYLANPATGTIKSVKGEFRPLEHQTYRPLQPTGNPGEYWAAIYDKGTRSTTIGRYSDKTFTFKPVLNLPDIELNSMDIWVDGPGEKVYFVYEGHLLAVPMKSVVSSQY